MFRSLRVWRKGFIENKNFFGWCYAIRMETRGIWFLSKMQDALWWIRYRTYKKFHIVKLDLTPGYHDIDQRLIHANFCLLAQYVEKEDPFETVDWDDDDTSRHAAKEIKELYSWWKNIYPKYEDNNPLHAKDVKCPEKLIKPYTIDADGDPTSYTWEDKPGQEEVSKKFSEACAAAHEYEKKQEEEIEANLIRLIKLRQYLWT